MNRSPAMTLADAYTLFLKEHESNRARSKWGQIQKRWFDDELGKIPLEKVRLKDVEKKRLALCCWHKESTLTSDKSIIMRFFRWADEAGLIRTNPIAGWRITAWRKRPKEFLFFRVKTKNFD